MNSVMQHNKRNKRSTFSADLTVIELSEQLGLQVLMSEYPEQNAGQESAVLSTHVGQSTDHVQLFQKNQLKKIKYYMLEWVASSKINQLLIIFCHYQGYYCLKLLKLLC